MQIPFEMPELHAGHRLEVFRDADLNYSLHSHEHYELYYFVGGDISYLVERRHFKLSPHCMLLLAPNVFHGFQNFGGKFYDRYSIHFLPDLLEEVHAESLLKPFYGGDIFFDNLEASGLLPYLDAVVEAKDLPEEIRDVALRARLTALLSEVYRVSLEDRAEERRRETRRYQAEDIILYISRHLAEPLSIERICQRFYISRTHLGRIFSQATGTTVNRYISYKRAVLARQYILQGQTATEAAINAGFRDYSNFYRTHTRLFGFSPSEQKGRDGGANSPS
ncbi:MAG: AraC family transcriptional regulator [Oscillospiraceae bacterium]